MKNLLRYSLCSGGIIILLLACQKDKETIRIIQSDQMVSLISDYQMACALANQTNNPTQNTLYYTQAVFLKYKINNSEFSQSMAYYLRHPKEMAMIYTSLQQHYRLNKDLLSSPPASHSFDSLHINHLDSILLWQHKGWLLEAKAKNHIQISLSNIKERHIGDELYLKLNTEWLYRQGEKKLSALITVKFTNNSSVSITTLLDPYQAQQALHLPLLNKTYIRNIKIQFFVDSVLENFPQILSINNLSLYLLHKTNNEKFPRAISYSNE